MRHEVANCRNKKRTVSKPSKTRDFVKNKQIVRSQIQLGTHLFNHICSYLGLRMYVTVTLLAVHGFQLVLLLRCWQWKMMERLYQGITGLQ